MENQILRRADTEGYVTLRSIKETEIKNQQKHYEVIRLIVIFHAIY